MDGVKHSMNEQMNEKKNIRWGQFDLLGVPDPGSDKTSVNICVMVHQHLTYTTLRLLIH